MREVCSFSKQKVKYEENTINIILTQIAHRNRRLFILSRITDFPAPLFGFVGEVTLFHLLNKRKIQAY